jgi:hypothetical protein
VRALAVVVLLASPLAYAEGETLCSGLEPKDVACRIAWDAATDDERVARYEIALADGTHCASRVEWTTIRQRDGEVMLHAPWTWANPYTFKGACFPALGEQRAYRVRACDNLGACGGWSLPLTIIGTQVWEP